jgi:RecA/RadA recombinase
VDSLTSLPTEIEAKDDMADGTYGTSRAKQIGKGFRKYLSKFAKSNTSVFFIDQTRDNVGVTFGPKETVSGGRALEFYSTVRIYLKHAESVKNKRKQEIGIWVDFRIVKNKIASPFKKSSFRIIWDYGLDDIASNVEFLKLYQDEGGDEDDSKNRKSPRVEFDDKKFYVGDLIKHIEENGLEEKLRKEVWRCWKEYHKTEDRKPRIWQ